MNSEKLAGVKLFRKDEAQFTPGPNGIAAHGLVNAGFSKHLGAGVGVFERCSVAWTPDYDEVLFILDGELRLRVGAKTYVAGAGDVLWIPEGIAVIYEAEARTTFFYAVCPVQNSISTKEARNFPESPPHTT
ncbi:MAG: cupin domain-containing protein [Burkholderiales bacterium]